jgi:hypothetical protein
MRNFHGKFGAWGGALALLALNWFIVGRLASVEHLRYMHSVEGSFIAVSRYIASNWGDLSWFPLWYGGIPWQNAYWPLLPLLTAALASLAHSSAAVSFHSLCAMFYCLGPAALFLMAQRLSGSAGWSLLAGLFYSLLSPSALLLPAVRQDVGGPLNFRRLHTTVYYGDGPFMCSLALLPIAILALERALENRRPLAVLVAALAMASVVLTDLLGGAVLAVAVAAYLLGMRRSGAQRHWLLASLIALFSYALAAPLLPPSTLATFVFNASTMTEGFTVTPAHMVCLSILVLAAYALDRLLVRTGAPGHLRFSLFFLLFLGALVACSALWGVSLLPQAMRYHIPLEMASCVALAFVAQRFWPRAPRPARAIGVFAVAAFFLIQAGRAHAYACALIQPLDIRSTTEYEIACWFDRNMPAARVMAAGTVSYYMNIFTDVAQLGGGAEQGASNWQNRIALYVLTTDENAGADAARVSALWLKAFGVRAIAMGGPASGEHYKPFRNPRKFEGLLPEVRRSGDDYVYAIPTRSDSLAHVVASSDLVAVPPLHGLDVAQLERYVAALEDASLPLARMKWTSRHSARIEIGALQADQRVSVQVTYHPGWSATAGGARRAVDRDGIGLMSMNPQCDGPCVIELTYDGGLEMKLARTASLLALLTCLAAALRRRRKCLV